MRKGEGWRWSLLSLGIYAAMATGILVPFFLSADSSVIGQGGDPWQTMWRFEEHESQVMRPEFWTEFFGGGAPRLINYSTLPWLPLQVLFGQPGTYNLVWWISFVLSGISMYALMRYLLKSVNLPQPWIKELAAGLSGLYYMLLPFHVAHSLGHFGAMQLQWLPLAILLWLRFAKQPTVVNTLGLGIILTIQAWTEHHYMLWLALFFILYSLFFRSHIRQLFTTHVSYVGGLGVGLLLFVVLPYSPTIRLAMQETSLLNLGVDQTIRFSADLLSYITPSSFHPLWGGAVDHLFRQYFTGNSAEATQYIGLVVLLLIIFFRQKIPARDYYFWVTVAAVFFVISFGPRLHILGRVLPIPLPYALIDSWPVFSSVRAVGRAGVMVGLGIAVLLGWVVATQVRRAWVGGVLLALVLVDFMVGGVPRQSVESGALNTAIQSLSGSRIIELPAATNYTVSSKALYNSVSHGKEVVGTIALERAEEASVLQEVRSLPALRHLLYLRTGQLRLDRPDFFDQQLPDTLAETLGWLDAGGIVVHRDSLSTLQVAAIDNFLTKDVGLTGQEFPDALVYPISSEVRQRGDGVFLARDGRWENVGFDEKRGSTFAEIPTEAGITLYNSSASAKTVRLRFAVAQESHGNMLFVSDTSTEQLLGKGGDTLEVKTELAPHTSKNYVFRNQLTQKVIIQDPSLTASN